MSLPETPEEGEYIIGRVIEVKDFGANLELLEYSNQRAFVHISEVASGWVKYIRDFIREGQMVVAKVTKVKKSSNIVDASVRQVSGHRKQQKIREWKNEQRASKLFELVENKSKFTDKLPADEIQSTLRDKYGNLFSAFESAVVDSVSFKEEWEGPWVKNFIDISIDNVTPPYVSIGGRFELISYDSDGVSQIKKALLKPKKLREDTTLEIHSSGSPYYSISVKAPNYKQAEEELKTAVESVLNTLKKDGGNGNFQRS